MINNFYINGAKRAEIKINRVRCLLCGDMITSGYRHDFVTCSCGSVSVDGGHDYLKRSFKKDCKYEELSEYEDDGM